MSKINREIQEKEKEKRKKRNRAVHRHAMCNLSTLQMDVQICGGTSPATLWAATFTRQYTCAATSHAAGDIDMCSSIAYKPCFNSALVSVAHLLAATRTARGRQIGPQQQQRFSDRWPLCNRRPAGRWTVGRHISTACRPAGLPAGTPALAHVGTVACRPSCMPPGRACQRCASFNRRNKCGALDAVWPHQVKRPRT